MDRKFANLEKEIGDIHQKIASISSEGGRVAPSSSPESGVGRCQQDDVLTTVRQLKSGQEKIIHEVTESLAKTSTNFGEILGMKQEMTSLLDNVRNQGQRVEKSQEAKVFNEKLEMIAKAQEEFTTEVSQRMDSIDDAIQSAKLAESKNVLADIQAEIRNLLKCDQIMDRTELDQKLNCHKDKLDKMPTVDLMMLKPELNGMLNRLPTIEQIMLKPEIAENFTKICEMKNLTVAAEGKEGKVWFESRYFVINFLIQVH